jgi:radical SAM superfamily enzyme YgiQ (UPF0313 family)
MKILFVYPSFSRHADHHPELRDAVPMQEYLGSPSLGIGCLLACTPPDLAVEYRDDRLAPADADTDADLVALSFFTPAASRAMALADHFRRQGKLVVAGGIFPTMMPAEVAAHVDAVVVGEGEGVWAEVLRDAAAGQLRALYRGGPVDPATLRAPDLRPLFDREVPGRFEPDDYPLQIARGCPLRCEACALPGCMGDSVRVLSDACIRAQAEQLASAGKRACLSEDTAWFPGTPAHRRLLALFDAIEASSGRLRISYAGISMPQVLSTPLRTLHLARRAGVRMFYLVGGFDPITTRAFTGRDPVALARATAAIERCREADIEPYTSFLVGHDDDDAGTADRILAFTAQSGIRKAEFAIFTPYPGTPAWKRLQAAGRILHRDWSRYNDANVVFQPARLTPEDLTAQYLRLWREFYARRPELRELPPYERTIQF